MHRAVVESLKADSDAIDVDHAAFEEVKKQLNDPEAKAIPECYVIKPQLNEIKEEEDKLYANRSQLFKRRRSGRRCNKSSMRSSRSRTYLLQSSRAELNRPSVSLETSVRLSRVAPKVC